MPDQFEVPGKKRECPGDEKVQKTYKFEGSEKKESAWGRCLVSCTGTLFLLDDDVVDKLFSF